jgi:large subunit ribosomal protein L22
MAQITVKHKFVHEAPRKLRLMSDMVRGLPAERAVAELATVPQAASRVVRKAIMAGIAAAREQGLNAKSLFIAQIMVDEGPKLRRFIPQSRGRSQRILKRMSHITVSVTDEAFVMASGRAYKKELARTVHPVVAPTKKETIEPEAANQNEVKEETAELVEAAESTEGSK